MNKLFYFAKAFAIFFCLSGGVSHAAQWASVSVPKAVVYADIQMSSPIGYLTEGQKIRVGEVQRNKGRLLPTTYKGKVVYIRVEDVQTAQDLLLVTSASERAKEREKLRQQESKIGVSASSFMASSSDFESSSDVLAMSGFGIMGQTRKHAEKDSLKMKLEYLVGEEGESSLAILLFTGEYSKDIVHYKRFTLAVFAGASLSPWSQYELGSLFKVNGYGAGASAGLEAVYSVSENWSFQLEGKYQHIKLFGFDLPEPTDENQFEEEFSPALGGPGASAILSYSF